MIAELAACARFSLRISERLARERGDVAGFYLSGPMNSCKVSDERMALRLGPDEWLLTAPLAMREAVPRDVDRALQGSFYALVDISDRNVRFEVSGPHARDLLAGGCALDLDDATFAAGTATRTLFGKAGIVLIRPDARMRYELESLRSFAPYVRELLGELEREFTREVYAGS